MSIFLLQSYCYFSSEWSLIGTVWLKISLLTFNCKSVQSYRETEGRKKINLHGLIYNISGYQYFNKLLFSHHPCELKDPPKM